MRHLIIIPLLLALGGCAGVVDSLSGRTSAGSALTSSTHVTQDRSKSGCPDFSAQGSVQANGMHAACTDSPSFGHSETFSVDTVDPNQALATAFTAQSQQTQALYNMIGPVLQAIAPFLLTAATGGVIPPIPKPIQPVGPTAAQCEALGKTLVVSSSGTTCG